METDVQNRYILNRFGHFVPNVTDSDFTSARLLLLKATQVHTSIGHHSFVHESAFACVSSFNR